MTASPDVGQDGKSRVRWISEVSELSSQIRVECITIQRDRYIHRGTYIHSSTYIHTCSDGDDADDAGGAEIPALLTGSTYNSTAWKLNCPAEPSYPKTCMRAWRVQQTVVGRGGKVQLSPVCSASALLCAARDSPHWRRWGGHSQGSPPSSYMHAHPGHTYGALRKSREGT